MPETDQQGAPVITRVGAKISALERRAEYLEQQIAETTGASRLGFQKAELSAIEAAIRALRYHRATVEGLDGPLELLADLATAIEEGEYVVVGTLGARAKVLLDEWAP